LIRIPSRLRDELFAAGNAALPGEAVGFVFGGPRDAVCADARAERYVPLRNIADSPEAFRLDAEEVAAVLAASTTPPLALFHSHPTDLPAPSTADVRGAEGWTDLLHLILSLRDRPNIRCWRIFDGQVLPEGVIYE
jgi:proteasome lid subunit RPN8/RPN11